MVRTQRRREGLWDQVSGRVTCGYEGEEEGREVESREAKVVKIGAERGKSRREL